MEFYMEDIKALNADIFRLFDNDWALLTAGTMGDCNAMTISWGQLGSLWGMPGRARNIATVFVKPNRHTFSFMERHSIFTLCWFPKEFRKDLGILGSKSGRDGDKLALTGLTPRPAGGGVSYEQASLTLVCRKIYCDQLKKDRIPAEAVATFYSGSDGTEPHWMFIGEVTAMERKA
jgi:flavin reductase (DIM6/NTAB) family NADH-FMN oxidoreductase RutF